MSKKHFAIFIFLLFLVLNSTAQGSVKQMNSLNKGPKLVVGIVIDQMRWDYLYRFSELYGSNGFNRLVRKGFSCDNTLIPYMPTYTAPGHTCIYTGSVPAIHGIVGNNWYDKATNRTIYCAEDLTAKTVGTESGAGKMSPRNMWTTSITDELKLSNNFQSKVIGIALKDRGAIFPAGHSANAAYWYDNGKWITSNYYMNDLPNWVKQQNAKDLPSFYMSKDWNTLLPLASYHLSTSDDQPYETPIKGEKSVTFPHMTSQMTTDKYESFKYTPYAASYTFDFAKSAIENEKLGAGKVTDFLAISISSTDYIGHSFGPNSIEAEDAYLRLDKDIAGFLQYLDNTLGKDSYLIFLTADHGVTQVPAFLNQHKIPGGTFLDLAIFNELNQSIEVEFGIKKSVLSVQNYQVYLNKEEIILQQKNVEEITQKIISLLKNKAYINNAVKTEAIELASLPELQKKMFVNGFNPKRSGDIVFTTLSGFLEGSNKGTSHGAWNPYDS
ncbi:MAG: alkaline phosphatase family protein, partial [Chitinophagia bacterium]|nr:alkaline phosphatase family protein [Chitinophagia bacterium]